jgi:hypothetical protein
MLVKLVHFYIIEPQRSIGGLIFFWGGGVDYDIEQCHFLAIFYQTFNLTLVKRIPKNCKKLLMNH